MSTANPYDTIVRRNTALRTRDVVFAVLVAVGAAFSIGSITSAAHRVAVASATPAATPAAPASQPGALVVVAGACSVDASC